MTIAPAIKWLIGTCILANGHFPNPDIMDYKLASSRQGCIEMARVEWAKYYKNHKDHYNLFTLCHSQYALDTATASPQPMKDEIFWVKCDEVGFCWESDRALA